VATTIATSTFAQPLTRVGARALLRLTNGNLLLVAHTGTAIVSLEGATLAALAAATPVQIAASTGTADATNLAIAGQAEFIGTISAGSTPTRASYASGAWTTGEAVGAGTANAAAWDAYVLTSGGTDYYHVMEAGNNAASLSNFIHAGLSTTPSLFSAPAFTSVFNYNGANCFIGLPWNGRSLSVGLESGGHLMWSATQSVTATGAANTADYPSAVLIETLGAGYSAMNNLAGVADAADGTGNAYIAYNDTTGIVVRGLSSATDATMSGHSWSAKVSATTQVSDKHPALFCDSTTGHVYLYWIDGGAANAIKRAPLTISGGVVTVGATTTIVSTTATRNYLTSIRADSGTATLAWTEGTANPYVVMATQDSVAPVAPSDFTLSPTSASGLPSVASGAFTVAATGTPSASVAVALSDGGAGGTFTPSSVTLTATANPSATFTYTPSSVAGPRSATLTAQASGGPDDRAHGDVQRHRGVGRHGTDHGRDAP